MDNTDERSTITSPATASPTASSSPVSTAGNTKREGARTTPAEIREFTADCLTNCLYHASREQFLDGVHRWLMFGVVFTGSSAMVELIAPWSSSSITKILVPFGAVFGILDLTFDLSNRARMHSQIRRRYYDLLADFQGGVVEHLAATAQMLRISGEEEPEWPWVLRTAWNAAQEKVYGKDASRYEICFLSSLMAHVWPWAGYSEPLRVNLPSNEIGVSAKG